ncbi:MAG: N-acetyltransferase [Oscillibacter sp.]|nr:N-acetyltransferase [Oscillibacter sp.]
MKIRFAQPEDAAALLAIYKPYVEKTAVTFEYDVPTVEEFRARIRKTLQKYPYLVAEDGDRALGYAYAGPFIGRAAADWAVEVSIYVDRDCRGKGAGRALYEALETLLGEMGILNLNASIAVPEEEDEYLSCDSLRFHARLGYAQVGQFHRCGYKFGRWYHLAWMEKHIGEHLSPQPPVKSVWELASAEKLCYTVNKSTDWS